MSNRRELGNVNNILVYEQSQVEWKITNFCNIAVNESFDYYESPTFFFANVLWRFQLWPKSFINPEYITLYLQKTELRDLDHSVEYNLGLKRTDNNVESLVTGRLRRDQGVSDHSNFIMRSELLRRKCELMPSDVFTITCTLKHGTIHCTEPNILNNPEVKKLIKLETLSENLKSLSVNKENCDITLHVQDKEYKAHKAILIARSSVFAAMFQHETSEKKSGIINIPDCDPESFKEFLEFLYCGKLEELPPCHALHLYKISDKYDIQELKTFCSEFLMANLTVENLCDIVILADKYDDTKLLSAAQCFFNNNLNKVFESSEWVYLMTNNRRLANKLLLEMSSKMKAVG